MAAKEQKLHATLSASGSSKWLKCPGSIAAAEVARDGKEPVDQSSVYANEGTLAHEVADLSLKSNKDAESFVGKKVDVPHNPKASGIITADMARFVQEYLDYVRSHETAKSVMLTEAKVDFSNVVPEGFGTLDSAVIDSEAGVCHIFDLKYGQGVAVSAFENSQGMLYALGLHNEIGCLNLTDSFRIHIVQPRKANTSYYDISIADLVKFGKYASKQAKLAMSKNAKRVPGEVQCKWCPVNDRCPDLAKHTQDVIMAEFDNLDDIVETIPLLTTAQMSTILDNKSLIELFLKSIQASAFATLESGDKFEGYKLVRGRANRKWTNGAEKALFDEVGDEGFVKKIVGLGVAERLTSKEFVNELTYKPEGTLTLAPEFDKRPAVDVTKIEDQFSEVE